MKKLEKPLIDIIITDVSKKTGSSKEYIRKVFGKSTKQTAYEADLDSELEEFKTKLSLERNPETIRAFSKTFDLLCLKKIALAKTFEECREAWFSCLLIASSAVERICLLKWNYLAKTQKEAHEAWSYIWDDQELDVLAETKKHQFAH